MSENHRNPLPTIDIIIELSGGGVVLIERKNIPHGWALPGGFVDYGEKLEAAAVREAKEETSLEVHLIEQFLHLLGSKPRPAPAHDIHGVYRHGTRNPAGADDAKRRENFHEESAPRVPLFLTTRES